MFHVKHRAIFLLLFFPKERRALKLPDRAKFHTNSSFLERT
jgi:hypothetical protein